jgi:transcription initiation factor TFIIIB Brf1 subunit/transcription initiation factor TFIIB
MISWHVFWVKGVAVIPLEMNSETHQIPTSVDELDDLFLQCRLDPSPIPWSCSTCRATDMLQPDHDIVGLPVCGCGTVIDVPFLDKRPKNKYPNKDAEQNNDECVDIFIDPLMPKSSARIIISSGGSAEFAALRRLQNSYMPADERILLSTLENIRHHCEPFGIPDSVCHDACFLFKQLQENGRQHGDCTRGIIRKALLAATVFHTCRRHRIWKTYQEISTMFDLSSEQLSKGLARFTEITMSRGIKLETHLAVCTDFVIRFASQLGIPMNYMDDIISFSEFIRNNQICSSNTPVSVAGVILLYLSRRHLDWNIDKFKVAQCCNISPVTVVKICRDMELSIQQRDKPKDLGKRKIDDADSRPRKRKNKFPEHLEIPSL